MDLLALAGRLRFQPWQLTSCPPAGPSSSCLFWTPSPMALSTSSPAFGPSHCPSLETVSWPEPQLPCPAGPAQPSCPRPAFLQPSAARPPPCGAWMCPYTGIHPRRLHASHAPSPLDLGTAFLPQHPAWCSQAHSCRRLPWVFGYPPSTLLQGRGGGPSLSDSSPLPQGNCRMPPLPAPDSWRLWD